MTTREQAEKIWHDAQQQYVMHGDLNRIIIPIQSALDAAIQGERSKYTELLDACKALDRWVVIETFRTANSEHPLVHVYDLAAKIRAGVTEKSNRYWIPHPGTFEHIYGDDPQYLHNKYYEGFNPVRDSATAKFWEPKERK